MTDQLPEPLVPPDCDLQDFSFMPLEVLRLRDSELATRATGDEFRCAVLLWCASWHQVPAGSLPDDEVMLAKFAGFGFAVKEWRKVKDGALRGWIQCSDGRLYHRVVAEKARDAWLGKLRQQWKTECYRIKKHCQRHKLPFDPPDFEVWLSSGRPQGQPLHVPRDKSDMSRGQGGNVPSHVPGETASKGQGEGQGQRKEKTPQPPEGAGRFPDFWAAWPKSPRKGGKPECLKLWQSKHLEAEADTIIDHVRALAATEGWTKAGGEFVPAPAVYLRGRRWDGAEIGQAGAGSSAAPWLPGHEPWAGAH